MMKPIGLFLVLAIAVTMGSSQTTPRATILGKIHPQLPSVYITVDRVKNEKNKAEKKRIVFFRLHNNLKTAIQIQGSAEERGLGDLSVYYDLTDGNGSLIDGQYCHVCSLVFVKSGKSLLFSLPEEKLVLADSLQIHFSYSWETRNAKLAALEPRHQVVFPYRDQLRDRPAFQRARSSPPLP